MTFNEIKLYKDVYGVESNVTKLVRVEKEEFVKLEGIPHEDVNITISIMD